MHKFVLLLLAALLLTISFTASAQDARFCGGLSDADCELLYASEAAMAGLESATFTVDATLAVTRGDETETTTVTGGGSWVGALPNFGAMMNNPMTIADPFGALGGLGEGLTAFDGTLNLLITNMDPGEEPATRDIQLVLVDGIGYVNFDALFPREEGDSNDNRGGRGMNLSGWGGVNLVELLAAMPNIMGQMGGMMGGQGGMPAGGMMGGGLTGVGDMNIPDDVLMNHVTITRLADADYNGTTVAVFQTTVDIGGIMTDPTLLAQMAAQMAENAPEGTTAMTPEQMGAAMGAMFPNTSFTNTQMIGLEDNFVRSRMVEMTLETAGGMGIGGMMGAAPGRAEPSPAETPEAAAALPATQVVSVAFAFDQFNSVAAISVPEGAEVIPTEDLIQLLQFFMMPGGSLPGTGRP
ncbi:MAG: hypothetical protein HXY40_17220 [Chloroflexi bacterium]|nr:hypothetical protein [Chloroflexota bacterium]